MYIKILILLIILFSIFNFFSENYDNYGKKLNSCNKDNFNKATCLNKINQSILNTENNGLEFNSKYNKLMPKIYPFVPKKNSDCSSLMQDLDNNGCDKQCEKFGYKHYRSDLNGCVNDNCIPSIAACNNYSFLKNCGESCGGKSVANYLITGKPYYFRSNYEIRPLMASCGYSSVCSSNLAVGTYNPRNSYATNYPKWSKWVIKKYDNKSSNLPLKFNDLVTIQIDANKWYLTQCGNNNCDSYSDTSVSCQENVPDLKISQNGIWKLISPIGKKGYIEVNDNVKITDMYNDIFLNICGNNYSCGSGKSYEVNTIYTYRNDSKSTWVITDKIE